MVWNKFVMTPISGSRPRCWVLHWHHLWIHVPLTSMTCLLLHLSSHILYLVCVFLVPCLNQVYIWPWRLHWLAIDGSPQHDFYLKKFCLCPAKKSSQVTIFIHIFRTSGFRIYRSKNNSFFEQNYFVSTQSSSMFVVLMRWGLGLVSMIPGIWEKRGLGGGKMWGDWI